MNTASSRLYETDFYGWIQAQAATLRAGNFSHLDMDNLIEEIESMGKSEQRELESRLETLLVHLLKWQFQPKRRGSSWELTIAEQRRRIIDHLMQNPSLRPKTQESQTRVYRYAIFKAAKETKLYLSNFPKQCPWTFEQVTDPDFWPDNADKEPLA